MKKIGISLAMIFLMQAAAGFCQDYKQAGLVLDRWSDIMDHFTGIMEAETDPGKLAEGCFQLADSIELMVPQLKDLMKNYPEIFVENPPGEMMPSIKRNQASSEKFGKLMGILTNRANENPENEEFQEAFARLNKAVYLLYL